MAFRGLASNRTDGRCVCGAFQTLNIDEKLDEKMDGKIGGHRERRLRRTFRTGREADEKRKRRLLLLLKSPLQHCDDRRRLQSDRGEIEKGSEVVSKRSEDYPEAIESDLEAIEGRPQSELTFWWEMDKRSEAIKNKIENPKKGPRWLNLLKN